MLPVGSGQISMGPGPICRLLLPLFLTCLVGTPWAPVTSAAVPPGPPPGLTGNWQLSGSITQTGCLDASRNGTKPAPLVASAIQVRDRFTANAGVAPGSDKLSLEVIGTIASGAFTATFTGVRRGRGPVRGSLTGRLAGNALTLTMSGEIEGIGCTFTANLAGSVMPADPDSFLIAIDPSQVLPQVRLRPGTRALALNQLLPNARTVGEELTEAFDRLLGVTGSRLSQNPGTGVASATLSGKRFAFKKVGLTPAGRQEPSSGKTLRRAWRRTEPPARSR